MKEPGQSTKRGAQAGGKPRRAKTAEPPLAVIAIGASAGGLDALEKFFDFVPNDTGAAYVVIQHLDPNFRSMMDELLSRHSGLPIRKAETGMPIEPNVIYLNPARQEMRLESGRFRLFPSEKVGGLNLPINSFFASAAAEFGARAIGVILSGTGSDGTKGCEAIKKCGGGVFVQEPSSAKFDSMPSSVLAKNLADGVAAPENLPALIAERLSGDAPPQPRHELLLEADPFATIFSIIKSRYDIDFSVYKHPTMERRIRRRMGLVGCLSLVDYADFLAINREEVANLFNDLLVDVTAFFRDAEAFEALIEQVVKPLVERIGDEREIRVWVAGCSSGEEAYSIAICFAEAAEALGKRLNLKILATDIHAQTLAVASAGLFPASAVAPLPAEHVERYFEREGDHVRIRKSIRRLIVFSQHNILKDPPFARIDLLTCRNVLIYFDEDAQKFALNLFHFCLVAGGVAFLGPSESLGDVANEFKTVNQKWRIFTKTRDVRLLPTGVLTPRGLHTSHGGAARAVEATRGLAPSRDVSRATFAALKELLARFAPPGFLLSRDGTLLHIFGDASKYIDLKPGVFTQKIADMLPRELALVVANGLGAHSPSLDGRLATPLARMPFPKFRRSIRRETEAGERIELVSIEPVSESEGVSDFLLLTIETREEKPRAAEPAPAVESASTADEVLELRHRNQGLLDELQSTEENLQSAIEELATSNEELQSTNEELMASNEELQSTNEELHSVNEELYSVTSEHQRKIDELIQVTLDMEHLLKATEIGTIFLDDKKHVRRYTPAAAQAFNLIPHDVGRPISHITVRFDNADFHALLDRVSESRELCEKEVSVGGRGYLLRILPYRVDGEDMQGSVVTLVDIDKLKRAQAQVRELDRRQRTILASMQDSLVSWDARTNRITFCNQVFASVYETSPSALVERDIFDVLDSLAPETLSHVRAAIEALKTERKYETLIHRQRADGGEIWRTVIFAPVQDDEGATIAYVACGRDVSEQVRHVAALKELSAIEGDLNLPVHEAIRPALEIGLRILGLDRALASEVAGDHHRVIGVVGAQDEALAPGTPIWLPHDLCNRSCGAPEPETCRFCSSEGSSWPQIAPGAEAYANCPEDEDLCEIVLAGAQLSLRDGRAELVETERGSATYIGIRPQTRGKVYAAVSFFSDSGPKYGPLTNIQRGFVKQIAQWIGLKIEAHNAHQALLRNESKLRLLFNSVPQSIWLIDAERRVLRANRAAASTVGRTPEDVVGMDIDSVLAPLDADWRAHNDEALTAGRASYNVLTQAVEPDGAVRWTSTDRIPYRDAASDENAMLLIVTSDITQLKARETALSAANAALDASQIRFERLYRHTPVMMCSFLADRSIAVASDALLEKTGRARENIIGRDICDLLDPESRETLVGELLPSLADAGYCQGAPLRLVASDHTVIEVEFSAFAETETEPELSYLCVLVDVTARNRAQEELQRANMRLASANEGLEKFAHVASHDLQEPLRKISVFGKMLADEHGDALNAEGRHCLEVMTDAAVRMRDLVHNILAFSYANNAQADIEDIPLDSVVVEVVNELDAAIRSNAAIVVSAGLPVIRGDMTGVQQLVRNLVSNAIKYRRAEEDPRVAITAQIEANGDCVLRVRDNGRGIEASQQALIFQPFTRLMPRSKIAGSGLGLAICKSVCERRAWTISVESEPGVGSTFAVVIPAQDVVAATE
ncbi:PAS domain S-box-containing protein [Rhodoblastus acidophilus]|uniref:CheR family methyltransferase n=1 Tax=Rhodoblastus acidophilus TaxID=1074 RepID=UPI0018B0DAD3|nr:CheR family methyltransferase [Rhodoblastus acidophilus]MCW2274366.1 PAS domain S-box-containing protein [Rhodoblastus acidophilus]